MILLNKDYQNLKTQADHIIKSLSEDQNLDVLYYNIEVWNELTYLFDDAIDIEAEFPDSILYSNVKNWQIKNTKQIMQNLGKNIDYCQKFYQMSAFSCKYFFCVI